MRFHQIAGALLFRKFLAYWKSWFFAILLQPLRQVNRYVMFLKYCQNWTSVSPIYRKTKIENNRII